MKRKRKLKKKFKKLFNILIFVLLIIIVIFVINKIKSKEYIVSIEYKDKIKLNLIEDNDLYCILSNDEPNLSSSKWIKSNDNSCYMDYHNEKNIYIKKNDKIVYSTKNNIFFELKSIKEIYLANNDEFYLFKYSFGNLDKIKIRIDNKDIIKYSNGFIKPVKNGTTNINIKYKDTSYKIKVTVTNLITKRPKDLYDFNKEKLSCEKYSKEENDLIDKILKHKVESVGYKTRASVVEAARFLTLDFPYRINYFYENGRLGTNKVDGEGRYYHEGLYLDESRYKSISGSFSLNNVGTWGCSIYSVPIKDYDNNGLDCSGFVSWALLNGGFDPGDLGAGFTSTKNLTDLGTLKKVNKTNSIDGTIKVGDLLHNERNSGHIAIIVGIDDEYYYVAQAVWFDEVGVIISKFKKEELAQEFPHVVLMDKYYINDGNLTNMW